MMVFKKGGLVEQKYGHFLYQFVKFPGEMYVPHQPHGMSEAKHQHPKETHLQGEQMRFLKRKCQKVVYLDVPGS